MDFQMTDTFPSADGNSDIAYYILKPKNKLRGVVQISHGMCEYFLRYHEFCAFLNEHGMAVVGNDHLGHGGSVKTIEELGWFSERNGWKYAVKDLHTMMNLAKQEFPGVPYVLMGHSMGSFLVRAFLTQYSSELSGTILCGTGGRNPFVGLGILLASISTKLHGQQYRSKFIDKLAFGNYCRRYDCVSSPKEWITRDKSIIEKYANDPYCRFTFTSSAFRDLFRMNQYVNSRKWASLIQDDIPILVISGDMDPVGDYGKGVSWVYAQLQKSGKSAELKLYPQARHEILNETNRQEVYADILSWFNTYIIKQEESFE